MVRSFLLVTLLLILMGIISSTGIAKSFNDGGFFVLTSVWAPVFFLLLYGYAKTQKGLLGFTYASAFISVSLLGLYCLSLTTFDVLQYGALESRGMVFVMLPVYYIHAALIGATIGMAVFGAMRLYKQYA